MTSNAVKYRDTKNKERELDLKAQAQPSEIALNEQQRHTSATQAKYNRRKTDLAVLDSVGNIASGMGKAATGIAALANDFAFYTKTGDAMLNLLKESTTDQSGRSKEIKDVFPVADDETKPSTASDTLQDWKPSIYAFDFVPAIGHDLGQMSSTAIAIRKFNTRVRGDNSGSTNYDSVDLFEYPLATDSVAYILAWLERGLDLVNYVDSRDLATLNNRLLITHCWGRADLANMFIRDSAGVISVMNKIINTLDALQIPFEIDYIKRHTWLCKKVFKYGDGVSKRYIIFRPEIYRVYDEASGSLKAYSFRAAFTHLAANTAPYEFTSVVQNILYRIVGPLANSQATATMSGDIAKAFGTEGVQFQKYPLNYCEITSVAFEEDEKYLMSIRNAIISPLASTEKSDSLYGDELLDLSIRQVINEDLNPILFMGNLYESGDSQQTCGPSLNRPNYDYIYMDGDEPVDSSRGKENINVDVFNYVDYRATNISEEDQLYNYSFRHNYEVGKDESGLWTRGVTNHRSEIIVRGAIVYSSTSDVETWRTFNIETFLLPSFTSSETLTGNRAMEIMHKNVEDMHFLHQIISCEKYAPMLVYGLVVAGDVCQLDPDENYYGAWQWAYLLWGRHFNRKVNTLDDLSQINYEALVNLFIQGGSMRSNTRKGRSRGKR